jgi:hypothetical protein
VQQLGQMSSEILSSGILHQILDGCTAFSRAVLVGFFCGHGSTDLDKSCMLVLFLSEAIWPSLFLHCHNHIYKANKVAARNFLLSSKQ